MTAPIPAEEAKQAIVQAKRERRDILARLRNLGQDIQAVERRIVDDYARADRERRG